MEQDSLAKFIKEIRPIWGRLNTDLAAKSQGLLESLAKSPSTEPWLANLRGENINRELYRDPEHGFILLAYTESEGMYRVPHDHGEGWVIYAVQNGEMEMGAYGKIQGERGGFELVRRESYRLRGGQSRVYLPGDIHDTLCISGRALVFRLTSCDLKAEKQAGRMRQYEKEG